MEIITRTDIGNKRKINQDYISSYKKDHELIGVVCDGMGGHKAGEIASFMCAYHISFQFEKHDSFDESMIQNWISEKIEEASNLVRKESYRSDEYTGMGTTVVVGIVKDQYAYISHVGDSRAYLIKDHQIVQLTHDDTLVNALVEMGSITKEDAKTHPKKNILLQAVGVNENLNISFCKVDMSDGVLLLCTDGLYNSLSDDEILNIIENEDSLCDIGDRLLKDALYYGGDDNIGFALIKKKGDM